MAIRIDPNNLLKDAQLYREQLASSEILKHRQDYRINLREALRQNGNGSLASKIRDCDRTPLNTCQNLYCFKCRNSYKRTQQDVVRREFIEKYEKDELAARTNMRHVTILHGIAMIDQFNANAPSFIMLKQMKTKARRELQNIKSKINFPYIRMTGAFEIEVHDQHSLDRSERKDKLISSLPGFSPLTNETPNLFCLHSHIIVDLNGHDGEEFHKWIHNQYNGPAQVMVQQLYPDKDVEESLLYLAEYPYKHPSYFPKHKTSRTSAKGAIDKAERGKPTRPYPNHILSDLAVVFDQMGVNSFRININLKR